MRLKKGLNLTKNYSYNFGLPKRQIKKIKFIIIHYTGMKSETNALKRLTDQRSKDLYFSTFMKIRRHRTFRFTMMDNGP